MISRVKTFPTTKGFQLRDITTLSVYCWINAVAVTNITITAALNNIPALNHYYFSSVKFKQNLIFILDEKSSAYLLDTNSLNISASVGFAKKPAYQATQLFSLLVWSITIRTAYRQNFGDLSNLNKTNSHVTALLFNPSYNLVTSDIYFDKIWFGFSNYDYIVDFILIMPYQVEQFKKSLYLNLTIRYDKAATIDQFFLEYFTLIQSSTTDNSISFLFRYVPQKTNPLTRGYFKIHPQTSGDYHIKLDGQMYITNQKVKIFPGTKEMEFFLFVNVSVIVPLAMMSKLIYKRLRI